MQPLVAEKLTLDLIAHINSSGRLLAANAAFAKQRAIFRLRCVNENAFWTGAKGLLNLDETSSLMINIIHHISDFYDLKAVDCKLVEKNAAFRLTILPDEPELEVTSVEELEHVATKAFGLELSNFSHPTNIKNMTEDPREPTKCYTIEATSTISATNTETDTNYVAARDREKIELFEYVMKNDQHCREEAKALSKRYWLIKPLTDAVKKGDGVMAKWIREREEVSIHKRMEEKAWALGVRPWKMSMLDEGWWSEAKVNIVFHPVWDYVKCDIGPEKINKSDKQQRISK